MRVQRILESAARSLPPCARETHLVGLSRGLSMVLVAAAVWFVAACDSQTPETCPSLPAGPNISAPSGDNCGGASLPELRAIDVAPNAQFQQPVDVAQAPGDDQTLYVVEREGRIERVRGGRVLDEPFLDIRDRVDSSFNERGLLGVAFHPEYADNGRFFIHYTPSDAHQVVVAEYQRRSGGERAANEEVRRLFEVSDPEDNHNGGTVTFGPDGKLYASIGDGGGAGDQHGKYGNALNIENPLGAILRFDVDAPNDDFIPSDNPFAGDQRGHDAIWHFGLRNPWRFSFDRKTGDVYIGDVGQNRYEEIDALGAEAPGGVNFGWRAYEGDSVYDEFLANCLDSHRKPIAAYPLRSQNSKIRGGCSVVGGYVYRGDAIPELQGTYLYGDYCSDDVVALRWCGGEVTMHRRVAGLSGQGNSLSSFGQGNDGTLYLAYIGSGEVKRIEAK